MRSVNGFDFIKWMREDACTKMVPVIVMSASAAAQDASRAYELGANAYMVKPPTYQALERLIRTIAEFWDAGEQPAIDWTKAVRNCPP